MDINATLIGQFLTFAILVWFTMKYVWPPVTQAMEAREKKIASGLEAAVRGKRELEEATQKASTIIQAAKQQASQIIEQANLHSAQLIEEARREGKQEGLRMVEMAEGEIKRNVLAAQEALKEKLAALVVSGAEKVLQQQLNLNTQNELLRQLAADLT